MFAFRVIHPYFLGWTTSLMLDCVHSNTQTMPLKGVFSVMECEFSQFKMCQCYLGTRHNNS